MPPTWLRSEISMGKEDLRMMASSLIFFASVLRLDQVAIFVGPPREVQCNKKALTPALLE
jgi:hypothetical protein